MSTLDIFNFLSQQINIYFGLSIMISGVIGGVLNIIIFTTLNTFRETTCGFYLASLSLVNMGQLITVLLVRILSEGFGIEIRKITSVCKSQMYIGSWCASVSLTIICLAAIDQYISMNACRRYSNKRTARRAIVLACIFWGLYCIFIPIYYDTPSGICTIINTSFARYISRFHLPVLLGFLSLTTMTTFSLLAFYNARTSVRRQINIVRLSRDRQLTAMTLCHVVFIVITTLPYIIFFIYSSNQTDLNSEQIARNNLIYTITILTAFSSFAGSFYIYCCVSERFRKQLLFVLTKICVHQQQPMMDNWNNNQVVPYTETIGDAQPTQIKNVAIVLVSVH